MFVLSNDVFPEAILGTDNVHQYSNYNRLLRTKVNILNRLIFHSQDLDHKLKLSTSHNLEMFGGNTKT